MSVLWTQVVLRWLAEVANLACLSDVLIDVERMVFFLVIRLPLPGRLMSLL